MIQTALFLIAATAPKPAPLMQDFIGLNTHTVQFRPELYKPVAKLIRNYHPVDWDIAGDPLSDTTYPKARNGVDWLELYGSWRRNGFKTEASAQVESVKADLWTPTAAFKYGETFSKFFGPSGQHKLLEAVEIGNEPVSFSDERYRSTFEAMARGMRKGDPKLLIAPCAVAVGNDDKYSKSLSTIQGLEPLYDVLNVHTYPFVEQWPTWRRSHPEDPKLEYLKQVKKVLTWRDEHAPGKQVWITEFGYDASTKEPPSTGDFSKWIDVSDEEQALYIVRSFLLFAELRVDRAYLFWFNDEDQPQLHGSSGLTRNYIPKPSYYAVAHLQKVLGQSRLERATVSGDRYTFEFLDPKSKQRVIVAWLGTAATSEAAQKIGFGSGKLQRLQLTDKPSPVQQLQAKEKVEVSAVPVFLWIDK